MYRLSLWPLIAWPWSGRILAEELLPLILIALCKDRPCTSGTVAASSRNRNLPRVIQQHQNTYVHARLYSHFDHPPQERKALMPLSNLPTSGMT